MSEFLRIYEDGNLVAFNKPAGVNFDWALEKHPDLIPVHRLDRETSGIILFAKNKEAEEYLRSLFKNREIQKIYLALAVGNVKQPKGIINLPIGRSKRTPLKRISVGKKVGRLREAVSEYKTVKGFPSFTLLEIRPKTGRTHQIRSHLAAIGHPVACDKLYSGRKNYLCPPGLGRQFLHAFALEFLAPRGTRLRLEASLPEDLEKALQRIEKDAKNYKL